MSSSSHHHVRVIIAIWTLIICVVHSHRRHGPLTISDLRRAVVEGCLKAPARLVVVHSVVLLAKVTPEVVDKEVALATAGVLARVRLVF